MCRPHSNACLSCRQRKLKCDRQQPCANCLARSVECKQQLLPSASRGVKRSRDESDPTIANILSRLDQLEASITTTQSNENHGFVSTPIARELNTIRTSLPTTVTAPASSTEKTTESISPEAGTQFVKVSANDHVLRDALMHNLRIVISADTRIGQDVDQPHITLPPESETLRLLQVYFDYVGQFQHIIHEAHAYDLIHHVYHHIAHVSTTTAPRGLALILSIIALAIILQPLRGDINTVLPIITDRLKECAVYIRQAMDCLEQHRRRMNHTLENVQAMLVLQFLISHMEAFSPRYRALLTEAVVVSHHLGLHRIDSTTTKGKPPQDSTDTITKEIKRRVWWYLTATDWMVSMAEGASSAMYLVQPKLIACNIPKHINDSDLINDPLKARPLSEPTSMSYILHRLKIAEMARCISDIIPHDPNDATCEMILSLDSKLESIIQELPAFFRVETTGSENTIMIDQKHTYIPVQRLLVNLMISHIRCRLHFPYLSGHRSKPVHLFSRAAGVKAALNLLASHRGIVTSEISHSADFLRIQGTILHMFTGAVVIATDLCCNQPRGQEREHQSSELMDALTQLEVIKHHSQIATKFLDDLTQLLVKYGVWLPAATNETNKDNLFSTSLNPLGDDQISLQDPDAPFPFDDLWETFVERSSVGDLFDGS